MIQSQTRRIQIVILCAAIVLVALTQVVSGSQGCPFDDSHCQEYCQQQGCNLGYCGHFAWIQCICRKCGDEWTWYDKIRYKPNKQVNQAELESLQLKSTEQPQILNNNPTTTTTTTTAAPGIHQVNQGNSSRANATQNRGQQDGNYVEYNIIS